MTNINTFKDIRFKINQKIGDLFYFLVKIDNKLVYINRKIFFTFYIIRKKFLFDYSTFWVKVMLKKTVYSVVIVLIAFSIFHRTYSKIIPSEKDCYLAPTGVSIFKIFIRVNLLNEIDFI